MIAGKILRANNINIRPPGRRTAFTSLHAATDILVLGTNVGSVYIYELDTLSLVKSIDNILNKSAIVRISVSPIDSCLMTLVFQNGVILVLDVRLKSSSEKWKTLCKIEYHINNVVTACEFSPDGTVLIIGDSKGQISLIKVQASLLPSSSNSSSISVRGALSAVSQGTCCFLYCSYFEPFTLLDYNLVSNLLSQTQNKVEVIKMPSVDSAVIQIEIAHNMIIISTFRRTLIGQLSQFLNKKALLQVGKSARKGAFGACFDPNSNGRLLAARPGKRLWIADVNTGDVLSTLRTKLPNLPSVFDPFSKVIDETELKELQNADKVSEEIINLSNFTTLVPFDNCIISYSRQLPLKVRHDGILMVIDTIKCDIVGWYLNFGLIADMNIGGDGNLYILHRYNRKVKISQIQALPINEHINYLLNSKQEYECAMKAILYGTTLSQDLIHQILIALKKRLKVDNLDVNNQKIWGKMVDKLSNIAEEASSNNKTKSLGMQSPITFKAIDPTIPFPKSEMDSSIPVLNLSKSEKKKRPAKGVVDIVSATNSSNVKRNRKKPKKYKKNRRKLRQDSSRESMDITSDKKRVRFDMKSVTKYIIEKSLEMINCDDSVLLLSDEKLNHNNFDNSKSNNNKNYSNNSKNKKNETSYHQNRNVNKRKLMLDTDKMLIKTKIKPQLNAVESLINTYKKLCKYRRECGASDVMLEIYDVLDCWFIDVMIYRKFGYSDSSQCHLAQWRSGSSPFETLSYEDFLVNDKKDNDYIVDNNRKEMLTQALNQCLTCYFECQIKRWQNDATLGIFEKSIWPKHRLCDFLKTYMGIITTNDIFCISNSYQLLWVIEYVVELKKQQNDVDFWDMISDNYHADIVGTISILKRVREPILLAEYLPRIFLNLSDNLHFELFFNFAVEMYPVIQPWYLKETCKDILSSYQTSKHFQVYLYNLIISNKSCITDTMLVYEWFELALKESNPTQLFRKRNSWDIVSSKKNTIFSWQNIDDFELLPIPNCQNFGWLHSEKMVCVLQMIDDYVINSHYDINKKLCQLFAKFGYCEGLHYLFLKTHHIKLSLELSVITLDYNSMERAMKLCLETQSRETCIKQWNYLFLCVYKQKYDKKVLKSVIRLLLKLVDTRDALVIISNSIDELQDFNINIINMILESAHYDKQFARLHQEMLEIIDGQLWTQTTSSLAVGEPFRSLIITEEDRIANKNRQNNSSYNNDNNYLDNDDNNNVQEDSDNNISNEQQLLALQKSISISMTSGHHFTNYFEDMAMSTHWGTRIDMSNTKCNSCDMMIKMSENIDGYVVFKCGHTYHSICLNEEVCTMCLLNNK